MRPSDRHIRIAAALILVAGLAACGVAIFSEQLGLGGEASRGTFGWKRISLLVVGAVVLAAGAALIARPRIGAALLSWLRVRADPSHWARAGRRLRSRLLRLLSVRFGGRTRRLIDGFGLLFVLGVYAVVQFMYRKTPALEGGDQLDYFNSADGLPDVAATHRHVRLGLLFPVRGAIEVFGYSEAAYYAVPFLAGLALAGFTYLLARMLFGWAVAVAAALLATLNPYVLWDSSHLLPDVPAAAALVGAMAALVGAGILHLRSRVDRWTIALLIAGGFLLGWAYLTREYLLVAFPLALVVFFAYRIPWRRLGWVALGAAPPLILEAVWGAVNYGDPLVRFSTSASPRVGAREGVAAQALDVIDRLPSLFLTRSGGWVFVALFFGVVLYGSFAAIRGDRRFLLPVAWTGGIWLVLTLSSVIPVLLGERAFLKLGVFRYWLPIMPALVIGGLAAAQELIRIVARSDSLARPLTLASLAAITFVTLNVGISSISHSGSFVRNGAKAYLEIREFLEDEGATYSSLYTDHGAGQSLSLVLPMYTRGTFGSRIWQGEIRELGVDTDFLSVDEIDGDLVVVRPRSIRWLAGNRDGFRPPRYLLDPPSSWQPVMITSGGGFIAYSVAPESRRTRLNTVRARDWRIAERDGISSAADPAIENGRAVIDVAADDSQFIFERRGGNALPGVASDEGLVDSGEVIWGRVEMATDGLGSARIQCSFRGQGAWTVISAAARGPYTSELESLDYRCRAPDAGGPFRVGVAIDARGPIELTIGDSAMHADDAHPVAR